MVFSDDAIEEVREELLQLDGVLVWVNPIQDGRDRTQLDALLREAAAEGVWVSADPDTILRMGTKEVLVRTRNLGWGTDTHLYETVAEFVDRFPARLMADHVRVLKQHRGNGGQGVWKIELVDDGTGANSATKTPPRDSPVRVQHADKRDARVHEMLLGGFMDSCAMYFSNSGCVIDQAFQARLAEGMVRCYLSATKSSGLSPVAERPPPVNDRNNTRSRDARLSCHGGASDACVPGVEDEDGERVGAPDEGSSQPRRRGDAGHLGRRLFIRAQDRDGRRYLRLVRDQRQRGVAISRDGEPQAGRSRPGGHDRIEGFTTINILGRSRSRVVNQFE